MATLSMRVYTGTNAGTQSASQAGIALLSVDAATNDPNAHQIAPGANSYEKWVRLLIDDPAGGTFTDFWLQRDGDLPDGVTIKMGVTDTPATPVATVSTVARKTMTDGQRYFFDDGSYDTAGQATRYLVIQEQVAAGVDAGAITQQTFTIGYTTA